MSPTTKTLACIPPVSRFIRRIEQQINKQTEYAVEKADVLLFLLDGKVGVTNEDRALASYFH